MHRLVICLTTLLAAGLGDLATGAAQNLPTSAAVENRFLVSRLRAAMTRDYFLKSLRLEFRLLDVNADGQIGDADREVHRSMAEAIARTSAVSDLLAADINADGLITEDELRQFLLYRLQQSDPQANQYAGRRKQIELNIEQFMSADADRDGRLSVHEIIESLKSQPRRENRYAELSKRLDQIIAIAPSNQNFVTSQEIESAGERFFGAVDTDGNGSISAEEFAAFQGIRDQPASPQQLAARREAERLAAIESDRLKKLEEERLGCGMPAASGQAKVVLFSTYRAEALSTTTIGSQDVTVATGVITIEPGAEPLYIIVATFRPTIWRLAGAIERVERLVLSSNNTRASGSSAVEVPLMGVTGIASDRVTFLKKLDCLGYFAEIPSARSVTAVATVRRLLGREPAAVASAESASELVAPSAEIFRAQAEFFTTEPALVLKRPNGTTVRRGENALAKAISLGDDVMRSYPGGIVDVDPASVTATKPAALYNVLPNHAGLAQLVQSGALARNKAGEYLIKQKIRFPAELHGEKFLLLRGVPEPEGDLHSCVIFEETGQRMVGASC